MANPQNINFLSPHNFELVIERLPNLTFFVQEANIPELILGQAVTGTPFSQIPIPGDQIIFGSLEIAFKVNEDMSNWQELYTWVKQIGFPESFEDRKVVDATSPGYDIVSEASLIIRTNANNPNKKITFTGLFPVAIGGLSFSTQTTDVAEVTTSASFRYGTYNISDA
jgi:hypothetical protein